MARAGTLVMWGQRKSDADNPRQVDSEGGSLACMAAVARHSGFNHLLVQPMSATLMITAALPVVFVFIFHYSERSVRDWMEAGLDSKMQLLKSIRSGVFLQTPAG